MSKFLILLIFLSFYAQATVFSPMSVKDQLLSAEGVIQGEVLAINSLRDPDLGIVSKVFVRADRWMGMEVDNGHIELYFSGGDLDGKVRHIPGAPSFSIGESIVVFTSYHQEKNWVYNLGMGKFSLKKVGPSLVMVNQVFPQVPDVGQMLLKNFVEMAQRLKGTKFEKRFKDKYERGIESQSSSITNDKSRSIASVASVEEKAPQENNAMWLVILLGIMGFTFRLSGKRNNQQ